MSRLSLRDLPANMPIALRRLLERVIEQLEVRTAQRGSPLDASPTFRDLIDAGVLKADKNAPLFSDGRMFTVDELRNWLSSSIPDWVTDLTEPPPPTGLQVLSNSANTVLEWELPSFTGYLQTLVYRSNANNLSLAEMIGSTTGNTYVDELPPVGQVYWYWIRHESKAHVLSAFNSTNGTPTSAVPGAPTVQYAFDGEDIVLSWSTPASNLAIQYYIVSHGAVPGGTHVGSTQSNFMRIRCDFGGSRTYWVEAVDIRNTKSSAASVVVTVTPPGQPVLTVGVSGASVVLTIAGAQGSLPIRHYDIRHGASWSGGTTLGVSSATRHEYEANWTGSRTFHVVAVDTAGNMSPSASVTLTPSMPSVSNVTAQVIDNYVMLRWASAAGTWPIRSYNVYRNDALVGSDPALFAVVFESVAGSYTYKVEPVDVAGNVGTSAQVTVAVSQPPDYVLYSNLQSAFTGTKVNALVSDGTLYVNVDTAETFAQHFTSRGWSSPQDQINAGYPRFLVGKTSGSYEEKVDYGTTIPSTKVTFSPTTAFTDGTVSTTPKISTSADDVSYTDYPGVYEAYASSFRYVKYRMDFSAAHNGSGLASDTSHLLGINPLTYRLDVKLKTREGVVSANAGDTGGTPVNIAGMFIDVQSITLTPMATAARHATYDFVDIPNPTEFRVYLWDSTGNRVSGTVSWTVRGI